MIILHADLHTHTLASGHAYSTIKEMADAAKEKNLELIASTDHGVAMEGACHRLYFRNLTAYPRKMGGVTVLRGIEANVLNMDAELDADERLLSPLDWVIASLHEIIAPPSTPAIHTEMYLRLADNPMVDMIGHPESTTYPFDYDRVIREFGAKGKIVEINNYHAFHQSPKNTQNCEEIARLCMKHGVTVAVNSDAHICHRVGETALALAMLERIGFPEELVLNAAVERVLAHVQKKHPDFA
ncbi:MAG: phosphatase [Synergistaceae bacterium]|nr:phosphatase [Synergistaceae bacterium]